MSGFGFLLVIVTIVEVRVTMKLSLGEGPIVVIYSSSIIAAGNKKN